MYSFYPGKKRAFGCISEKIRKGKSHLTFDLAPIMVNDFCNDGYQGNWDNLLFDRIFL